MSVGLGLQLVAVRLELERGPLVVAWELRGTSAVELDIRGRSSAWAGLGLRSTRRSGR